MQDLAQFIANHMVLTYALAIILILLMILEFFRAKRNQHAINTSTMVQLINRENAVVIDVRPLDMHKKGHIIDAHPFSASVLMTNTKPLEKFKKRPIIVVCDTGFESQKMAAFLLRQGYNAHSLAGGQRAWTEADLPLIKE
jgi:rhodanese-related sulfurtransferase